MKKFFKYISIIFIVLILIIILIFLSLTFFFNPNDFKPLIANQVKKYIHREVTIDGDLRWTFFPNLGIRVGNIIITNPPNIQPLMLIKIPKTVIEIDFHSLLRRKIDILGIDVSGASIVWKNNNNGQFFEINNAILHAKNLEFAKAFPLSIQFNFLSRKQALSANVKLDGLIYLDDAKQTIVYQNISGTMINAPISGTINAINLSLDPYFTGHFVFKPFDLKQTLKEAGQTTTAIQEAQNAHGILDFSSGKDGISITSNFIIDSLQISDLRLTKVNLSPRFQKGILDLSPITAFLYQGTLQSQMKMDFNGQKPLLSVITKLNNLQAEPLLRDVIINDPKMTISGIGNIEFQVTGTGADSKTIMRSLNGSGNFNFNNGALKGIDLAHIINTAYSLIKKTPALAQNSDKTNFDSLTGTMIIHNGILINDDFLLESPTFQTKGRGKIDLPSQWINYLLYTTIKHAQDQKDDWMNLYGVPIPVAIRGTLNKPAISLDAGELLKAIANKQLDTSKQNTREEIKKQVREQIEKNVPGEAGKFLQELIDKH